MSSSPQGSRIKMKRPSEPLITESGETFKDEDILDMAKADLVKILKLKVSFFLSSISFYLQLH